MFFWFCKSSSMPPISEERFQKNNENYPQNPDFPAPRPGPFVPAGVLLLEIGTSSSTNYVKARGKPSTWLPRGKLVEEAKNSGPVKKFEPLKKSRISDQTTKNRSRGKKTLSPSEKSLPAQKKKFTKIFVMTKKIDGNPICK